MNPQDLAEYSVIAVYSASAVYAIAFIVFTLDLVKRGSTPAAENRDAASGSAAAGGLLAAATESRIGTTVVQQRATATAQAENGTGGASRWQKVGFSLTVIAWLVHVGAVLLRGIAAERVPWANMFEFALTGTAIIAGVFILVQLWRDLRFLGAYVTGMVTLLLALATINFYVDVVPLPPALQSIWLVIHVLVAILATGFFALGAGLSILQLLQQRREARKMSGVKFLQTLPGASVLETLAHRVTLVGFVFWTFTLIFGAVWAERAWGRYWGWDTKEVWTFVIWVVFAGYIHARATRGWNGSRAAWLAIIGFAAVLFNFTVVNLFFQGLHAYSGL
ncbi:MAG: c-type cytochrome biogenesis protein CcsB [Microbacteriaceae bacterium]